MWALVGKQLGDDLLRGFRSCEETPEVEQTAVCTETDVNAVWQVPFCLKGHDAEEAGEQGSGKDAYLLGAV